MNYPSSIEAAARSRIATTTPVIAHTLEMVRRGCPLASETNPERLARRIQSKLNVSVGDAEMITRSIRQTPSPETPPAFPVAIAGTAKPLQLPNTENGALWRAIENYVLRNAVDDGSRICCFTGPVLRDSDPAWRGIRLPLKYWKVVVWPAEGKLHSLAMIADQEPVLNALDGLPENASEAEAFNELQKVDDFLTTVAEVERLTKLDFGKAVREADVREGEEKANVDTWAAIPLSKTKKVNEARKRRR